ncbi:MAG: hypothetical protein RL217_219, partial [Pseudomonadota bacterium]
MNLYGQRSQAPYSARKAAALALAAVIGGQSLQQCLAPLEARVCSEDRTFLRDLVLGSCRHYFRLNALAKILLKQPLNEEDQDLHALLIVGLYQLALQGKAPHAAVHATVEVCDELGKAYAKPVINACLRRYGREYESLLLPLDDNPVTATSHPKWLVKMLTQGWPEHWPAILDNNNQSAPICLRVNTRQIQRDEYLTLLQDQGIEAQAAPFSLVGIYLAQGMDVTALPHFADGWVSVQDEAAQLAALFLAPQNGEHILDACAAPGGKTCHILEQADAQVLALDIEEKRLERVRQNLERLQLSAQIVCADLSEVSSWWNGTAFDAILLDAPCSATGVIRRHPDIKLLRRREDIDALVSLQTRLLDSTWQTLKRGGRLLYATCSVLPQENHQQIEAFLARTPDAKLLDLTLPNQASSNANLGAFENPA